MIKILLQSTPYLASSRSLLVCVMVLFFGVSWAQSTNDYRSITTGNWNATTTWERFNGSSWVAATVTPTNANANIITIQNAHTVSITASVTVDQVVVAAGGQVNLNSNVILTIANGTGTDFQVEGTFSRSAGTITISTGAALAFSNLGTYIHAQNGGVIPNATWSVNSTIRITSTTNATLTGLNQNFGNFVWNSTGLATTINFNPATIAGNLEINNGSSTSQIILTGTSLSIGRNLIIGGGVFRLSSGNNQTRTVEILGDFQMSGGSFLLSANNGSVANISLAGNFSQTGGTIIESASGSGNFFFNGSGTPQLFTSGGTVSNTINWTVNSGAFLQMAVAGTTVTGAGTFTLSSGATLGITSPDGISLTNGTTGNIRVTGTRSYSVGANYVYNGNANQSVGNGLPATVNSLIVANTGATGNNRVTLDANKAITSDLGVESGVLDLVTFTANRLTLGGNFYLEAATGLRLSGSSNFPTSFSSVILNCSSTVEYYANGPQTVAAVNYGNLLLSGSGAKTLQLGTTQLCSNLTLSGTASTTAVAGLTVGGNFAIGTGTTFSAGSFTHQVNGNWTNQGTFTAGTSTFNFAGSTSGILTNSGTGQFFNLSFSGSGAKTIATSLTPTGDITQVATAVTLSGSNTLTLATDKTMEINASGSFNTGSGRLIIQPGANYINRSTSNPTLEVQQRFTGDKGWRLIGSPITTTYAILTSGFETQGFTGATNPTLQPNLLWWDETDKGTTLQGWRQPSSLSSSVPAGRGHYFYVFDGDTKPGGGTYSDGLPRTMAVTGTEVNLASGNFTFGVTFTPRDTSLIAQGDSLIEVNQADEGFNLVANPTASVIDFHSPTGWTKTNIDQSIYVWDPATSSFLTWNGTSGSLGSGRIAPFQAFWVKANAAAPLLRIDGNGVKSLLNTDFFARKLATPPTVLELNVIGEGMSTQSFISFGENGEPGADPKDAYQLESLAEDWLLLYSFGSLKTKSPLVINHQPLVEGQESRVIPLHLAAAKKGEPFKGSYLMNWKLPENWDPSLEIVLMDHSNQKAIDMKKESAHSFELEAPKSSTATARKAQQSELTPRAVVFQTPYSLEEEEIPTNSRVSADSKPKRPFTLFIGKFPEGRIEYLPDFPKLYSPAPNPFVDQTKIRFFLPTAEQVEVKIYSLMGDEVGGFPKKDYPSGIHELEWMPQSITLPKGLYVIRLVTPTGQFTQKLIKN